MTIIIGLVSNNKTYIAADNQVTRDFDDCHCSISSFKIFKSGGVFIGTAGEVGLAQKLYRVLEVPTHDPSKSNFDYVIKDLIPMLDTLFTKANIKYSDNKLRLLIVYKDIVGRLNSDLAFIPTAYDAIGSGADFALGSLTTSFSLKPKMPIKERLTLALDAAVHNNVGCAGPYTITEVPR